MTVAAPREPESTPATGGPRGHLRGRHIFWSLIAGLIIVGVAIFAAWLLSSRPDPSDHDAWADLIRSAVLAAGAIAAVPAGYVAYRKQQTTEAERHEALDKEQRRRDELVEANTRADAKDYRDRYAAASGQLGSDKAAIRLAGVYALTQLADEWGRTEPDQRQVCIDVLCAYLRMPWPAPPRVASATRPTRPARRRLAGHTSALTTPRLSTDPHQGEETQVRAAILKVAAAHVDQEHDPETAWWSNNFDLSDADDLPGCWFAQARFDGAFDARGATFSGGADFTATTFSKNVAFTEATFSGEADFTATTFAGAAAFQDTTFTGDAAFIDATFTGTARFDRATFTGNAHFTHATFCETAWFENTTFTDNAWFERATFSKIAAFRDATFSRSARFTEATFTGQAVFRFATVARDAAFGKATFSSGATFRGATFVGDALFGDATFSGSAVFRDTMFSATTAFGDTTFFGDAVFERATFKAIKCIGATVVGKVIGPDSAVHAATSSPRPLRKALLTQPLP